MNLRGVNISESQYLSVTQFNKQMVAYFNGNPSFRNVYVKGEVSRPYVSPAGHFYFVLKDKNSRVPCVVFKNNLKGIGFDIEHGMKLLVIADIGIYWPHGKYQLNVLSATEDGLGKLFVRLQQLKRKLKDEGLFDVRHKKELPRFAKKIGVITSREGSVIHDIIKTVNQKWPYCQVIIYPAAVQGASSKRELIAQIKRADESGLDILIVARGGGSLEELQSFNEEEVARTIFNTKTPIISAIGHEDNNTLSDMVADVRASTPTMAAGLAVEDRDNIQDRINHFNSRLNDFISKKLEIYNKELDFMLEKPVFKDAAYVYGDQKLHFDELHKRFDAISSDMVKSNRADLEKITTEYVIRHPCKMQLDQSKHDLDELTNRLIDAVDFIINNQRVNLDKASDKFNFLSDKLVTSKRHDLSMSKSYFITNPCQGHVNDSRNELEISRDKLISQINRKVADSKMNLDSMSQKNILKRPHLIYLDKSQKLDILIDKFKSASENLILASSYELNSIKSSPILKNPENIHVARKNDLEAVVTTFENVSNRIILDNSYRLDSYKKSQAIRNGLNEYLAINEREINALNLRLVKSFKLNLNENKKDLDVIYHKSLFKNPKVLYESKRNEFDKILNSKTIRNPYHLLENSRNELKIYEEKMDKINNVIMLKKEQQRQKSMYIKIIAAIVIAMIIIIIVMLGGIL